MLLFVLGCLLASFWVAYLGTFLMRWLAPRWGLMDIPAQRKVHLTPKPLGGGLAIWAGVVIPLGVVFACATLVQFEGIPGLPVGTQEWLEAATYRGPLLGLVIGAGSLLAGLGLWDDFRPLPWQPRLLLQVGCGVLIVAAGIRGSLFVTDAWWGNLLTVLWIVMLVNSFNFLDNMDGLSGGIGFITSSVFAVMMLQAPGGPRWLVAGFFLLLAGSLLGFLCHNWNPARIFMGDSGSYFVGFCIASMTILGTFYTPSAVSEHVILAPLCVLAIPLYDLASVMWIRLREGRSPFQPDKRHFSHRLVAMGFRPLTAVLTIHLATLVTSLGGLALYHVPDWTGAAVIMVMVAGVVGMIGVLEQMPGAGSSR